MPSWCPRTVGLENGMVRLFSTLSLLSGQSDAALLAGLFMSDLHLQPCCSRITVGGSPPSRQTASLLMLRLGQGVEHDYGSCFLVLVTLSLTDVIALSAQLTQLCGLVPPSADSRAGAGMSASTGIYSLTHSPLGYRSPSKRGSMVALCFRNCICRLVELICSYLYLRSHLSLF